MSEGQTTTNYPAPIPGLTAGTWLVDPDAGHIAFAVKTMWGLVDVKGTFDRFEGALIITETGITGELVVHTDSLDTKNKKRDEHLRSADFFDAQSHPRVTFATTAVTSGANGLMVSGDLSVGAARTHVELPVDLEETETDAVTLRGRTSLPREDVGLSWNKAGMIKGPARLEVELRLLAPS